MKRTSNKTDIRYWVPKVGFHTSESRTLSVQIQDRGQRKRIGLGTADKQEAAVKARDLYLKIKSNGWENALQWLKSSSAVEPTSTLEEFLSEVRAKKRTASQDDPVLLLGTEPNRQGDLGYEQPAAEYPDNTDH